MGDRSAVNQVIRIAAVAWLFGQAAFAADCRPDALDLRWPGGTAHFLVEIADSQDERAKGLMFRDSLAPDHGMIFVYDSPRPVSFWMKNTLIPLDMLFIAADGRVLRIVEQARPLAETPIPSGDSAQFVLELAGGTARSNGITDDAEMRSPLIAAATAIWPCAGD